MVSLTILTSHRNGETHTMEKFAVYFISKKSAKIFSNVHDEFIASFPTFERAKDFCDINNECGYMDDRHVGYEVRKVETNEGK